MRWLDHALALVLPPRCYAKIHATRVDEAFDRANAARSRKIEAADETISANDRHRQRVEGEAAVIRERTAEQEQKWPNGRTSDIRQLVEAMLRSMDLSGRGKKGERP